jgi:hypothetical protein
LPFACRGTPQPAKTALFAGGNEAAVRKSAAGDFFPLTGAIRMPPENFDHELQPLSARFQFSQAAAFVCQENGQTPVGVPRYFCLGEV